MIEKIEQILDEYVRPRLSEHYGNVRIINFKDETLEVRLEGQCSNCPSARFTVEDIVEKEIISRVPEVKRVVLIEGVSDSLLQFAKKILQKEIL